MATSDRSRYTGTLVVDLESVQEHLLDLSPEAIKEINAEHDAIDPVKKELAVAMVANAEDAHIPPQPYQRFLERTFILEALREKERELKKLVAILEQTSAELESDRDDDIRAIAGAAQAAAERKNDPGIAGPFAATIQFSRKLDEKAALHAQGKGALGHGKPPVQSE